MATKTTAEAVLLTVDEAAAQLALSRTTIYGLMERGQLAFVHIGRLRRIPRKSVVEFAEKAMSAGGGATLREQHENDK